jgi:hypothetical protein
MGRFDQDIKDGCRDLAAVSEGIEDMLHDAPPGRVKADWLVSHLFDRSPEILFLVFTPIAIVPATSTLAGALLLMAAMPMMFRRHAVSLPRNLAFRTVARAKVERAFHGLIAVLRGYEAYALRHPHPPAARHTRWVGFLVALLALTLLVPLPFSNILPGFAIGTVALASLEQDGKLMLMASALATISILAVAMEAFSAFHVAARIL